MRSVLITLFIAGSLAAFGQKQISEGASWSERIYVGGGGGFNAGRDYLGNKYLSIQVSPVIGYMITQHFSAGTNIVYNYVSFPDLDLSTAQYGGGPFLRYNVQQFFGMVEYNFLSVDNDLYSEDNERVIYDRLLAGVGISQPIGNRGAVNIVGMYDVLYENSGPFNSPWVVRVFFSF